MLQHCSRVGSIIAPNNATFFTLPCAESWRAYFTTVMFFAAWQQQQQQWKR